MAEIIDLNINIGANTTDFEGQLQKAQNLLKQFEAALKKATNVGEINYLNNSIKNLNSTIAGINQQMNKVGRPTADATNALSNLSRVAQDAPYGFIGIANNLNPLLESFQRLSKESGSSTQALKSMAAGLVGPAGIGLALGVVSSLAVTYSDEISAFFKGPTEKLKTFREELNKLNQDIYKIVGEAQSNRTIGLNLVNIIAGGDTKQQEEALKKLKSLYSENAAIKDATIKTDKAFLIHLINVAAIQEDAAGKEKNTQQVLSAAYTERAKLLAEQKNQIGALKPIVTQSTGIGDFGGKVISVESQKSALINKNKPLLDTLDGIIASAKAKNLELNNTLSNIETPDGKGGKERDKKDPFAEITKDFDKSLKAQEILRSKGIIDQQTYLDNTYKIYEDYINKLAELDTTKATNKIENLLPKFDKMTLDKNALIIKNGIKNMLDSYQEPKMDVPEDAYAISQKKLEEARNKYETFFLGIKEKKVENNYKAEQKDLQELTQQYEQFAQTLSGTVTNALFGMYEAMQQGENPLQVIADMFKQIAFNIAAMVIQALIFQAIIKAFPALEGAFTALGIIGKAAGGLQSAGAISGGINANSSFNAGAMGNNNVSQGQFVLKGSDLVLATQRANNNLNIRRGY